MLSTMKEFTFAVCTDTNVPSAAVKITSQLRNLSPTSCCYGISVAKYNRSSTAQRKEDSIFGSNDITEQSTTNPTQVSAFKMTQQAGFLCQCCCKSSCCCLTELQGFWCPSAEDLNILWGNKDLDNPRLIK